MDKKLEKQIKLQERAINEISKTLQNVLDEDEETSLGVAQLTIANIYSYKKPEPPKPQRFQTFLKNFRETANKICYKSARYGSQEMRGWLITLIILISISLPTFTGYRWYQYKSANWYPFTEVVGEDFRFKESSKTCLSSVYTCLRDESINGMNKVFDELQDGQSITVPKGEELWTITRKNHLFEVVINKRKSQKLSQ